jgi:hypothetical protein
LLNDCRHATSSFIACRSDRFDDVVAVMCDHFLSVPVSDDARASLESFLTDDLAAGEAFSTEGILAAARAGELAQLVTMLDPEVVFRADSAAMRGGPAREVRGAAAVAKLYSGRAQGAGTGLVDGAVGVVVAPLGRLMMVIRVRFAGGRIAELDVVADPAQLRDVEIAALSGPA